MKKFGIGPRTKSVLNFIFFALSFILLIYNLSIIGFFYLIITYGEEKGFLYYSLVSLTGIFLISIPLVFRMAKQKYYHFILIATHFIAAFLPFIMQKMSGLFSKIL